MDSEKTEELLELLIKNRKSSEQIVVRALLGCVKELLELEDRIANLEKCVFHLDE